jgi:hypothetical protein
VSEKLPKVPLHWQGLRLEHYKRSARFRSQAVTCGVLTIKNERIQQRGYRLIITLILFCAACSIFGIARSNAHSSAKQGLVIGGFSIGPLLISFLFLLFCVRGYRAGVYLKHGQIIIRRVTWTSRLSLNDVDSFSLERNALGYAWYGAIKTRGGGIVKLPFAARSMDPHSYKNHSVNVLMERIRVAICKC